MYSQCTSEKDMLGDSKALAINILAAVSTLVVRGNWELDSPTGI